MNNVFFSCLFLTLIVLMQASASAVEDAKVIRFPEDCKRNIFAPGSPEKCWVAVTCDIEPVADRKVYLTYHCPLIKKLYMTKKKGPKFNRLSSALLTSKGLYVTSTHDKAGIKKSSLVFIEPQSMVEDIKATASEGVMFYINSELKLLELKPETCTKNSFKLEDVCYSSKERTGIL